MGGEIVSLIVLFLSLSLLELLHSAYNDYPVTPVISIIEEYVVLGESPSNNPWWVNFIQRNDALVGLIIAGGFFYSLIH